jgi:endo-1,4-beta-xylanase
MVSFTSIFTAAVAASGALAAPVTDLATRSLGALTARAGSAGTHNGCYYSWWTDGGAQATYTNGAGGSYSVSWKTGGNLVGGKGWNPGAARYVSLMFF